MELGSAGAILSYALNLEKKAIEAYEECLEGDLSYRKREVLEGNARSHRKNLKTLHRMKRENVTEMILEPIHDLESDAFNLESEVSEVGLGRLPLIEQTLLQYLRTCAQKVSFLPSMSQKLEDIARRIAKNVDALASEGID